MIKIVALPMAARAFAAEQDKQRPASRCTKDCAAQPIVSTVQISKTSARLTIPAGGHVV